MDTSRPLAASCCQESFYQPLMKTLFLCNHCGILSANRQQCDRCRRQISACAKVIEKPLFESPHSHTKDSESNLSNSAARKHSNNKHEEIIDLETYVSPTKERPRKNLSEDSKTKAGARRPRKHLSEDPTRQAVAEALRKVEMQVACCKMKKRPSKRKHEDNPVCLTISSDEEDNCSIIEPSEPFSKSVKGSSEVIIIEETGSGASSLNSSMEVRDGGCIDCELSICECDMSEEDQRMCGGAPPRHPPFKQRKLNKPGCSVNCRSVRIGSCKITPDSEVVVSAEGIFLEFKLPVVLSTIEIHIPLTEVTGAQAYFGSNMPVLFISTSALCAKNIRNKLNMISSEASYFYPEGNDETQKRITMIISKIREDQIMIIKALFGDLMLERNLTDPVLDLLDMKDANDLLVRSTPPEFMNLMKIVKIGTDDIVETKLTAPPSPPPVTIPSEVAKMVIYPPPPATGGITITNEDFLCLRPGEFLNDVIIDFYLRYLLQEILGEEDRRSTHVFSTFFYKRLTQRPVRKAAILEEQNLPPAERRHNRVKTWSRHVDIFDKDFIVIPINENAHWYLAIVCYPSLTAPVYADDDSPVPPEELSDLYVPGKRAPSTTQAPPKMVCVLKDGTPIMVDAHSEDAEERDEAEPDSEEAEYVPLSQQRGSRQSESLRNGNDTGDQLQEAEHMTETDQSAIGALECETAVAQLIETENQSEIRTLEPAKTNGQLGESVSENRTENGENIDGEMEDKGVESYGEDSELCERTVNGEKELDESETTASGENREREFVEESKDGGVSKKENQEIKDNDDSVMENKDGDVSNDNQESAKVIKNGDESVNENKDGDESVNENKDGDDCIKENKNGGESVGESKDGDESVNDNKDGGESKKDNTDSCESIKDNTEGNESIKDNKDGSESIKDIMDDKDGEKDSEDGDESIKEVKEDDGQENKDNEDFTKESNNGEVEMDVVDAGKEDLEPETEEQIEGRGSEKPERKEEETERLDGTEGSETEIGAERSEVEEQMETEEYTDGDYNQDYTEQSEQESPPPPPRPIKQACILIFDSLAGPSRSKVIATIREYLQVEWKVKRKSSRSFTRDDIRGAHLNVPQQTNFSDCGVYLLHYVETFFKDPLNDFRIPVVGLEKWFTEKETNQKRDDLKTLILDLMNKHIMEGVVDPVIDGGNRKMGRVEPFESNGKYQEMES